MTIFLRVYFEEPFWIGLFETIQDGELSVCKVTFGAEPKDYEIQCYIMDFYNGLRFSPCVKVKTGFDMKKNPKRLKRQVKKQLQNLEIGTKSQQALKLQQEQTKSEHRVRSKKHREEEKQYIFELKQQKKKEKLQGR